MSTPPERPGSSPAGQDETEWTFDPWADRPIVTVLAALSLLAMWLLLAALRLPWLLALAVGVLVASPLLPATIPAVCRLEAGGASRRGPLGWIRRSWSEIRRVERVPVGVLLSPYARRHWLDGARALTLPMPRPRRDELASLVEARWRAHGR